MTTAASSAALPTIVKSPVTDITVYGATGFVAKHVLSYLLRSSIHLLVPPKKGQSSRLKVTLAGRNEVKLKEIKYRLSETMKNLSLVQTKPDESSGAGAEFDVFVAEASQVDNVRAMVARSRVILNCAGPFNQYGTEVVAACAELGTDYVDITGELDWAGRMREKYGEASKASGSRIVSFCGFDSIPSDVAVQVAVEALRTKAGKDTQVDKATTWVAAGGSFNAGTIHTMLDVPLRLWNCLFRPVPFLLDDPLVLTHPSTRNDPSMNATRNRLALAEWFNQLPIFHTFLMGGASGPFFMAAANAKVVHESAVALKYGKPGTFVYYERFLPVGFAGSIQLKALSIIAVVMSQMALILGFFILRLPLLGSWLAHTIFPLGSGMSDESCQNGFVEMYTEVESSTDSSCGGRPTNKVNKANCFLKFKGDPGNWVTAQCVSEAALCLLLDQESLPPKSEDGFGSPTEILGGTLVKRLTNTKIRPVECTTHVRLDTDKREWTMFN